MKKYRIHYETYIEVEADSEAEAREETCNPGAENELLQNLQELSIEEV